MQDSVLILNYVMKQQTVRYLKGTSDKGLILNKDNSRKLECYIDADFAGCWVKEQLHELS